MYLRSLVSVTLVRSLAQGGRKRREPTFYSKEEEGRKGIGGGVNEEVSRPKKLA